jgi:hypothetical protein
MAGKFLSASNLGAGLVQTLAQLVAALKDPESPLVIDLGGRCFTSDGVAAWPKHGTALKRSKSDTCPARLNDHVQNSVSSESDVLQSDSRFADEVHMNERSSSNSSSAPSVNPEASDPSIDNASSQPHPAPPRRRATYVLRDMQHARARRPRRRMQALQAAAGMHIATQGVRSDSAEGGHASDDTGDDAHVAAAAQARERHGAPAQRPTPVAHERYPMGDPHAAPARPASHAAQNRTDGKEPYSPLQYLDVVRPGTTLCNGSIEVPECATSMHACRCSMCCRATASRGGAMQKHDGARAGIVLAAEPEPSGPGGAVK